MRAKERGVVFGAVLGVLSALSPEAAAERNQERFHPLHYYIDDAGMHIDSAKTRGHEWKVFPGEMPATKLDVPDSMPYRPAHDTSKERSTKYDGLIVRAGMAWGVDAGFIKAIMKAESDFDVASVSRVGAKGLMQVMPAEEAACGLKAGEVFDPETNINCATKILRGYIQFFSESHPELRSSPNIDPSEDPAILRLAAAAHNAGLYAVIAAGYKVPEGDVMVGDKLHHYKDGVVKYAEKVVTLAPGYRALLRDKIDNMNGLRGGH